MSENQVSPPPSFLYLLVIFVSLLGFGLFGLFLFGFALFQLISDITIEPSSISFHKSAFYGLGGGIVMLLIISNFSWEHVFKREVTETVVKVFNRTLIVGCVTAILLPHLTHYAYSNYLKSKGYITCDEMSERWLHDRTIVYVKSDAICEKLIADKAKDDALN